MYIKELKLIKEAKGISKANEISAAVLKLIESPGYQTIKVSPKANLKTVLRQLESAGINLSSRDGVSGGCFGARDGKSYDGLTLWIHAESLPERVIDSDGDEQVNLYKRIENLGGVLVEGLDGDAFETAAEELGQDVKRDNTYNYSGDSNRPQLMFDADFAVISGNDAHFLSIKFHCGGDIRGNYTDKVVYRFDSIDDLYSALNPDFELKEV